MSTGSERFLRALHDLHRMQARFTQHIGPPLPPGEFFFLQRLCDGRHPGGMVLSALRSDGHVSAPAMSQLLRALERKGLIGRRMSEADRRRTVVFATPEGRALIDGAWRAMNARMENVIDAFGAARAAQLTELIEALNRAVAGALYDGKNGVEEP